MAAKHAEVEETVVEAKPDTLDAEAEPEAVDAAAKPEVTAAVADAKPEVTAAVADAKLGTADADATLEKGRGKDKQKRKREKKRYDENGKRVFTAESGLGFMRVVQVFNILYILMLLLAFFLYNHAMLNETSPAIVISTVIEMLAQATIIWLLAKRKMHARFIIPVLYVVIAAMELIADSIAYDFSVGLLVETCLPRALIIVYFLTSRRAKAVLVQPFDMKLLSKETASQRKMWNPKSVDFWMRILIYFFIFSVVGHWMEIGVQVLVVNGLFPGTVASPDSLTHRDSWNPFFIYGIAVAFIGLVLLPIYLKLREKCLHLWQAFLLSFLVNLVFVVVAEIVLGQIFNADYQAWDYRNQFLNWNGQVCLLYSLAFAAMASVFTWIIIPFLNYLFSFVGKDAMRIIFVLSLLFFVFLYCAYNVDLTSFYTQAGVETQMVQTAENVGGLD